MWSKCLENMTFILKDKKAMASMAEAIGRKNAHSLPRIDRVIINAGVGRRVVSEGKKALEPVMVDLARITGQKPSMRAAKKSIATFKLREGQTTGIVVTLRGKRAEDFLTRLIRVALPRTRDFRGLKPSALDDSGNLNIGITEQTVFPEAAEDPTGALFGFQVNVVTTARNREEGEILFRGLGFPLAKEEESA